MPHSSPLSERPWPTSYRNLQFNHFLVKDDDTMVFHTCRVEVCPSISGAWVCGLRDNCLLPPENASGNFVKVVQS
jgi:hypothetical protein